MLRDDSQVILLGSVATSKYVDILRPILGPWLRFPKSSPDSATWRAEA